VPRKQQDGAQIADAACAAVVPRASAPRGDAEQDLAASLSRRMPAGAQLGDWLLERPIAQGGFGVVYRAAHAETGKLAALKLLHPELAGDATAIARFEREVAIAEELQHPNVVRIFAQGRAPDGRPYAVMELLFGMSLDEHMDQRGRLSPEETLAILTPIASALDAAHARGVVHRDIKPSNVFLCDASSGGRVVLLDFGVAKLLDAASGKLTSSRQIVGTLLYMAPEQFQQGPVDGRADVYALGVLSYRMLTGQSPFGGGGIPLLRSAQKRARPPLPSTRARIPSSLDAPVLRALEPDPAGRQGTAGAFVDELRAALVEARASVPPRPAHAVERPAIAVHGETRVPPGALLDPDEGLLSDLEALPAALAAQLAAVGLIPVMESGSDVLFVAEAPEDPAAACALRKRVLDAVTEAHRRLSARPGGDARVTLGIAVHAGALLVSEDGALISGGLLDPSAWVPATAEGVVASAEALAGLGRGMAPAPGAPGFFSVKP
jgi:serine/threonine-protein kinase